MRVENEQGGCSACAPSTMRADAKWLFLQRLYQVKLRGAEKVEPELSDSCPRRFQGPDFHFCSLRCALGGKRVLAVDAHSRGGKPTNTDFGREQHVDASNMTEAQVTKAVESLVNAGATLPRSTESSK